MKLYPFKTSMTPQQIGEKLNALHKRLFEETVSFQNALAEKEPFQNITPLYKKMSYTLDEIRTLHRYSELIITPS